GGSLRAILDRGVRLTPAQALLVGLEATRALDAAHRRGFVHRDVKPANLLFGDDGRLRVADFGLARALAEAAWTEPQGAVLGTARYASPEQARGEAVDGRADVYALGLVLIEAVTGSVPFAADTTIGTLMARVGHDVEVPEALGGLRPALERAGRSDPARRVDARGMAAALMAAAGTMDRPEPLPLAGTMPGGPLDGGIDLRDRTTLGPGPEAPPVPGGTVGPDAADDGDLVVADPWADAPAADAPRRRRRWPVVLATVVLAAGLGTGAAWGWKVTRPPEHEVPNLVSLDLDQAQGLIQGFGWKIEVTRTRQDETVAGQVLSTNPARGEDLREGGTFEIVVSEGWTLAAVPTDLVGRTAEEAAAALTEAGFVPQPSEEASEDVEAGRVISVQEGLAPEMPKQTAVSYAVSTGPVARTVPGGLAGGTPEAAAQALEALRLVPQRVDQFSDTVKAGTVIGTRPAAGEQVARDATVQVLVSKGPDVVKVPSVAGRSLDQAVATLEGAGLTVGDLFGPAKGQPFQTSPEAGSTVRRGTKVNIYLL
ncbi:MAG: PASTA domain-containing protein, partial [Acidimicrobiia bacterium]